jgi:phage repressor protein C with HTH and peptisase S24 domain
MATPKTRGERLRYARERFFKSARLAAKAMGIAVSTYGAHERAEDPGGRDFGPDEAKRYARRFKVTPEWLLTGYGRGPDEPLDYEPPARDVWATPNVPLRGYVGAGAAAHFYEVAQESDLDQVAPPIGANENTVAVEIRGDSLGPLFNRWLVFYDDVRHGAPPSELIGELCVVGLEDGRVLIKQLQRGKAEGLYTLNSQTEQPIRDVAVAWAAKVKCMARR